MIDTWKDPEIRVTTIADEYGNSITSPGDRVAAFDGSDFTTRKVVYERAVDRERHFLSGRGC